MTVTTTGATAYPPVTVDVDDRRRRDAHFRASYAPDFAEIAWSEPAMRPATIRLGAQVRAAVLWHCLRIRLRGRVLAADRGWVALSILDEHGGHTGGVVVLHASALEALH